MNNRWLSTAAALLGLLAATHAARAAVVVSSLPVPSAEPNLLIAGSDGVSGVVLASRTLPYQDPVIAAFKGTVTEAVILDATTGRLDFVYQIHADAAAGTIGSARFTTTTFDPSVNIGTAPTGTMIPDGPMAFGAGYTITLNATLTAAGFVATTPMSSPPDSDRNTSSGIGFQRSSGTDQPAGAFGNILFLRTDATRFDSGGLLALIDSSAIARIIAFEPVNTPEPSTFVAALSGLALCGVAVARRRSRKAS